MTTQSTKGTALITGASTGIGAIYADRLARRGYDLILVARSIDTLDQLAASLSASTGRKVSTIKADLNVKADLRAVEQRLATDDSITMLVNNAGLGATATLLDSDIDAMEAMITLNVTALTRLTHAVAPRLVAKGAGAIINIASVVALAPDMLNGVYGGSKAFVLGLTQSMHSELAAKGVQVQAVLPGAIATPFWGLAGVPVEHLPAEIVMTADDLVDAALAGFDQGEVVTLPSLPELADWNSFDAARVALRPLLSREKPAARYNVK